MMEQSTHGPAGHHRPTPIRDRVSDDWFSAQDLHFFNEGKAVDLYKRMGAHPLEDGGTHFAVWAPNARDVFVAGDFNRWDFTTDRLEPVADSGIWKGVIKNASPSDRYKFGILPRHSDQLLQKADPFAFESECPPRTASVVCEKTYQWGDENWMRERQILQGNARPLSIYEVHLGSWRRRAEEQNRSLSYRELAHELAAYVKAMGYTHVELMPVMEHPFYGSWGYQVTGYFSPTRRYGTPVDFKYFVDTLHQEGIGVILDWVPSHFPSDSHSLSDFDGTCLFEHADPKKGFHPDWKSCIFNYGRHEVRSFLISNALFWLDEYHIDGLRVDAVASMLYLDYSRKQGEWIPNVHGGRENLEAIDFMRKLSEFCYGFFPDTHLIAEESTAWPMVSRPVHVGGLGFGMKWDMGWMHDTLKYLSLDPIHRKFHQDQITFRMIYAFNENFVLSLSHDEVVYGKGSLFNKMPGDDWRKAANLRVLFGNQYAQPGKKLSFMGGEFGQLAEWDHEGNLQWELLENPLHSGIARWVRDLNSVYRAVPALHAGDFDPAGFEWIDASDSQQSVLSFLRCTPDKSSFVLVIFNFTPVPRENYRIGVPRSGEWKHLLNSDLEIYGGSGVCNPDVLHAQEGPVHGRDYSLSLVLPPLGVLFLEWT